MTMLGAVCGWEKRGHGVAYVLQVCESIDDCG